MPAALDAHSIALDTLGKLLERGHEVFPARLDCVRLYRMDAPAEQRISSYFDIDLARLVEERGAASSCIRMEPTPALAAASSTPNIELPRHPISVEISSAPTRLAVLRLLVTIGSGAALSFTKRAASCRVGRRYR
jgi:hypothetical protein